MREGEEVRMQGTAYGVHNFPSVFFFFIVDACVLFNQASLCAVILRVIQIYDS